MYLTIASSLFFFLGLILSAQEPDFKDPISENKQLKEHGLVITEKTYKQGFSAYIGGFRPKFITSDSLLMAYTDLLERSIADQHILILAEQRELISQLIPKLPKPAPDNEAISATRLVIGTAHRILFGNVSKEFSEAEKKLIEQEATKVESHQGMHAPSWWSKNETYIPYSRFAVPSPWDKNDIFKQYYRYTQWMMSMPFDRADPHHQGIEKALTKAIKDAFIYYKNDDDAGLIQNIICGNNLHAVSALIQYKSSPDKALLDQVLQKDQSLKNLTSNLAVSFGNNILISNPKHQYQIDELKQINHPLFKALRALNQPAEKQAPKIFSSEAWQRKQLNCTLGAWAEYRHAIGITQTSAAFWSSASRQPVGFIEPVPEFFQALGIASEELAQQSNEAQESKNKHQLLLFALLLEEAIDYYQTQEPMFGFQYSFLQSTLDLGGIRDIRDPKSLKMLTEKLEQITQDYWSGKTEELERLYTDSKGYLEPDTITPRLEKLATLCYRLEAMSRKQLAKNPWSMVEEEFIKGYGTKLGHIMHYFGNSYFDPRDDAPSIIQIAHLGSPSSESILHCGNARPREILINYPDHNGNPVLCQGAVYNYREVISDKPITDKTWIESCKKSSAPTWLAPIISK